jgi:hypothetical protein
MWLGGRVEGLTGALRCMTENISYCLVQKGDISFICLPSSNVCLGVMLPYELQQTLSILRRM